VSVRRIGPSLARSGRILIVGAGPAGWSAAGELRQLGFAGEVTVVCDEPGAPYDRTACSKGLLDGRQRPDDVRLDLRACPGVDWRVARAEWLDPDDRAVGLSTGEAHRYDGLVIATGARAELPADWPVGEPGLHVLHAVEQAWALRKDLRHARRVAIVGGGLTGCEVASTVRALARDVVLVNSQPYLMHRVLGAPVAELVTREHAQAGIELRLGRRVRSADRGRGRWRLRLDDGQDVHADVVVMSAGERPDTAWLEGSGLDIEDGVRCDAALRAVGGDGAPVPGVVAAGVVARWPNLRYRAEPHRVGHWIAAIEQGQAAARTLLLGDAAEPATLVPRFWSAQLGLRIQVCGRIEPDAAVEISELRPARRDTARAGVVANCYANGDLAGVVAVNAPHAFAPAAQSLLAGFGAPPLAAAAAGGATAPRRMWAVR
jgi:NADPH-dependent 2,4-dienoyl-CoA reductase/sulfur reductase-like enzyme